MFEVFSRLYGDIGRRGGSACNIALFLVVFRS